MAEPKNLEEKLARLEEIVQELEGEEVSLERSLSLFEEGVKLAGAVRRELEESRLRVAKVLEEAEVQLDWEGI